FFYDLFHWQYFGIVAIIWIVVDLVWVKRWQNLIGRLGKLITKPIIFKKDKEPNEPPLYPREFLEQLALNSRREAKTDPDSKTNNDSKRDGTLTKFINAQRDRVFDPENPLRSLGYVISLVFFVFFLIADAIVVAATLVLMGVIPPDLPPLLQRLELAVLGGAVMSTVVGVWMLVEMSGKGALIDTDTLSDAQKKIFKLFAVTVTLFAVVVMIALAVQRLISLGYLESSPTSDLILSFVLYGLLAINNSLSAALTFTPAASGFIVLIYLLAILIIGVLPVLAFLADVIWRAAYILIDVTLWILFTPIVAIPYGIARLVAEVNGWINPSPAATLPAKSEQIQQYASETGGKQSKPTKTEKSTKSGG